MAYDNFRPKILFDECIMYKLEQTAIGAEYNILLNYLLFGDVNQDFESYRCPIS